MMSRCVIAALVTDQNEVFWAFVFGRVLPSEGLVMEPLSELSLLNSWFLSSN